MRRTRISRQGGKPPSRRSLCHKTKSPAPRRQDAKSESGREKNLAPRRQGAKMKKKVLVLKKLRFLPLEFLAALRLRARVSFGSSEVWRQGAKKALTENQRRKEESRAKTPRRQDEEEGSGSEKTEVSSLGILAALRLRARVSFGSSEVWRQGAKKALTENQRRKEESRTKTPRRQDQKLAGFWRSVYRLPSLRLCALARALLSDWLG